MSIHRLSRILPLCMFVLPATAMSQALVTTFEDGDQIFVYSDPAAGLPTPVSTRITGLPSDAQPHGGDFIDARRALVADFNRFRIFVVDTVAGTVLDTIDTTDGYDGRGSLAVSPDGKTAIAVGAFADFHVLRAPFDALTTAERIDIEDATSTYQTQGIVFDRNGRAFVQGIFGIYRIDPPYSGISATLQHTVLADGNGNGMVGALAMSPDGNTLLATNFTGTLDVYQAPFDNADVPVASIDLGADFGADGIAISPDGSYALVGSVFSPPQLAVLRPPFATATPEFLDLPVSLTGTCGLSGVEPCLGFEDITIREDGEVALATGNSSQFDGSGLEGRARLAVLRRRGDDFLIDAVIVGEAGSEFEGRGTGTARFIQASVRGRIFADGFEAGAPAPVRQ